MPGLEAVFGSAECHRACWMPLLVFVAALAGCATVPGSGPVMSSSQEVGGIRYDLVSLTSENVPSYHVEPRQSVIPPPRGSLKVPSVRLAPGAVLRVTVFEAGGGGTGIQLAGNTTTAGTIFDGVRVDEDGYVSLPYAGHVMAAKLTLPELQNRIAQSLRGTLLQPSVYVQLVSEWGNAVAVSGSVNQPGRVSLLDGVATVLDAINRAGGPTKEPHHLEVVLRRQGELHRISLNELLDGRDIPLMPGDDILVTGSDKKFLAMGAVARPGAHLFPKSDLSLLEGLAEVGGLADNRANKRGVYVFRPVSAGPSGKATHVSWPSEGGRPLNGPIDPSTRMVEGDGSVTGRNPIVFSLDFSEPEAVFVASAFTLRPSDVIYVTDAPSASLSKLLEPLTRVTSVLLGIEAVSNVGN